MNEQEVRAALIEWETLSANKENKALYEARLKYLRDQLSNLRGERRIGREEGRQEGLLQGKYEIAMEMLRSGLDKKLIMTLTKLSEEKIHELEEQLLNQFEDFQ